MNARINVPRILRAMREKGWGVRDTCANCGVNNLTLAKVLDGHMPGRLDAWYRIINGLEITEEEALFATTHSMAKLYSLPARRRGSEVA